MCSNVMVSLGTLDEIVEVMKKGVVEDDVY